MPLQPYLAQLETLTVPLAIAALIFIFSILCFGVWAARLRKIRRSVESLNKLLQQNHASARQALEQARNTINDAELKFLLRETEAGLIDLPASAHSADMQSYSFRPHSETWELRSLVGSRLNLALFETMPNLLIGFGLMCTFIFLAVALQQAGLALNAMDVSARQQDQALQSLIATAGGKFITSIAGLFCSLVWNWRAKIALENVQSSLDTLCHTLRAKVPDNAVEASVRLQITLTQELLHENRSQVGQLRRFESDFAQAIGQALASHMQPAFEKLALLADSIQVSSQSFGHAGSQAAGELSKAGAVLTQGFESGLASFHQATQGLTGTIETIRATVSEMDAALERSAQSSSQGSQQMTQLLENFAQTIGGVQTVTQGLQNTVNQIHQTADKFQHSASAIENAVSLQRAAANDFKDALVPMNQALGQTVQTLQNSAASADEALGHVKTHLQEAQKALTNTVDSLTQGVASYSGQVAELHTKMDQHLASAVNQLSGSITNLEEVLDEFIDALPSKS
jgi:predicted  nucleic acid-binding Zn-ribbon protein